jgi:type VI secretion system secreted protein VgrG
MSLDESLFLLGPPEFYERFHGRFFGKHRAIVKENNDPKKIGRVKVLCPHIYGNSFSPWCLPCFPIAGSVDSGSFFVPPKDSLVWIEFEEGFPANPIYTGGFYQDMDIGRPSDGSPIESNANYQANTNAVPSHAQGLLDGSDLDGSLRGTYGVPPTAFKGEYPNIRMIKTPSGHRLEFDDTPGSERVCLEHKTGAFIEILSDGSISIISNGAITTRSKATLTTVESNDNKHVKGNAELKVDGNYTINVGGSYKVNHSKVKTEAYPSVKTTVASDDSSSIGGSFTRDVLNNISLQAGGGLSLGSFGNTVIQSSGKGSLIFSNATNVANPSDETLNIIAQAGRITLKSTDLTGVLSNIGIVIQSQGFPSQLPFPVTSDSPTPMVFLGNIGTTTFKPTPLLYEPVVLGQQLQLYLNGIHTAFAGFCATLATGGVTPGFGGPNPVLAAAIQALNISMTALQTTFLTPAPPAMGILLNSDIVYTSKQ